MSTNLILIDSNLKDTDVLLSALNAQTTGFLYNYDTSRNTILQQIDAAFSVKVIERVAICCHEGVNQFLENGNFFDVDSSTNEVLKNSNTQFILDLLRTYNVSNIDFLACSSLKYDSWKKIYDLIENEVEGVTVGASEDETGNLKYGGNWVMENTGEQVDGIYFNEGLEYYRYLFGNSNNMLNINNGMINTSNVLIRSDKSEWINSGSPNGITRPFVVCQEVQAYDINNINISHGKFVRLSSIINGNGGSSGDYSIVNDIYDYTSQHPVAHTRNRSISYGDEYMMVSLGSDYNVLKVKYWPRFFSTNNQPDFTKHIYLQLTSSTSDYINYYGEYTTHNEHPRVFYVYHFDIISIDVVSSINYGDTYTNNVTMKFTRDIDVSNTIIESGITTNIAGIGTMINITGDGFIRYGTFETNEYINEPNCTISLVYDGKTKTSNTFSITSPLPPPTLDTFTITPTDIIVENHGIINMTFSDDQITLTDISNSLTVDPSNAGIIDTISNTTGTNDWIANFTPNYGLDLTDCSLNFNHSTYGINEYSNTFTIETHIQQIKSVILTPENIITDLSSNLEVILRVPTGDIAPTISIDPSYIANLDGNMTSSDGGLTWNGSINRTPGMNLLGNTLTVSIGDISSNFAFDVLENENLRIEWIEGEYDNITVSTSSEKYAFAFSRDGKTFAYGGGRTGFTGNLVTIYKYINMSWNSYDIINTTGFFARAVSLSDDGSKLVVGAPDNYLNDRVFIYNLTDTNYTQLREYSFDNTPLYIGHRNYYYHNMGRCVSISGNGNYIFFGNKYTRSNQNGKLYQIAWNAVNGTEIVLNTIGNSTVSEVNTTNADVVDCSEDGSIVIIGCKIPYRYDYYSSSAQSWLHENRWGCVHVFKNGSLKNTFYGTTNYDYYGALVCCSPDGLKVAFTSPGKIHIKNLNSNGDLVSSKQINKDPSSMIFSNDNTKLFIASGNFCYTYEYDGSNWSEDVENRVDYTDAKFFYKTDNNLIQMYGQQDGILLRVYENIVIRQLSSQITIDPSNIEYPNTTSNFQINFTTNDKTFDDISGNVSLTSGVSNIDTSSLALTNYGFRLEGNIVAEPFSESDTNKITYFETVDISGESANFTINTNPDFELLGCTLTPENLVDTDVSATLRIEFNTPITGSSPNFNFTLDPSYIATIGTMSDVSSGFVWEGTLTRTPNMNKLGNKLDFDFSYNGVEVSANLVYNVVENAEDNMWSLINSNIVNKEFNQSIQMSANGLLMGFIDGSNVEIYRKSVNWTHDVSYNGNIFSLANNHIVLVNNDFLQIYDYSGTSWNIMNGGNIGYSNIVALSINLDGTYVAISNNTDVKVLQNISDNWTHINTYNNGSVIGLSLSPNGLKLGMGIGTVGQDYSSIIVEDVVNNHPPVITIIGNTSINHEINSGSYTDQGATAIDEESMDLTGSIVVSGDTVDVAVLGAYQIYYDVVDARGNNSVRKIRVVNVVDTTNPVVTLNGDAEIDVVVNTSYTELGATASDNSNESLTVVIGGDNVDTTTLGDYTVSYTATDSTGNSHQLSRLIHIIADDTPVYRNPSTDILQFAPFRTNIDAQTTTDKYNFTVSGNANSYLNGDYMYYTSSDREIDHINLNNKVPLRTEWNLATANNTRGFETCWNGKSFNHHLHGTVSYNSHHYDPTTKIYTGGTTSNGSYPNVNHQQLANNSITYGGEFIEIEFPFYIKFSKVYISGIFIPKVSINSKDYFPKETVILGKLNDNTFNYISTQDNSYSTLDVYDSVISDGVKYKGLKIIFTKCGASTRNASLIDTLKVYGDIYTSA